ncbi:competence protein CoiA family protein [Flavobacterium wongokense]|uniref:competence protein CoiA family protein n=1 Tax=Flavobacterium wongokense TaxID=2910674 RepID=UPI001F19AEA0|nr:competence protein CoiA family protein [Flavobacterium sp. WG47]MCF6131111.1 hypothetical protein [Flavobacterium sp. WG47]
MLTAVNIHGKRITPYSDEQGYCPLCRSEVINILGEINIAHFRHRALKDCDSWSEGETEWHYNWKQKFPLSWQENTIDKFGEIHRADIQTPNGLVLELQNSSISTTTIKIREQFYGNMIWLVNAQGFKDNFKIISIVNAKLRDSNSDYYRYSNSISDGKSKKITKLEGKLSDCEFSYKQTSREIEYLLNDLKSLVKDEDDFENTFSNYLEWSYVSSMFFDFKSEERKSIKSLKEKIVDSEKELEKSHKLVDYINALPNCSIKEFANWKIVDFGLINPANHTNCKVIFRDSIDTFFPEIIDIHTSTQFSSYSRTPDKYVLIIDLTKRVSDEEKKIKDIENGIEANEGEIENLTKVIGKKLFNWITEKKQEILSKIEKKKQTQNELENSILFFGNEIDKETEIENNRQIEESKSAFQSYEKEQIRIKSQHKGKYAYYWKNKRKTWDFAEKPIYFDFGDCIFKITGDYDLIKMKTEDFIKFVKSN